MYVGAAGHDAWGKVRAPPQRANPRRVPRKGYPLHCPGRKWGPRGPSLVGMAGPRGLVPKLTHSEVTRSVCSQQRSWKVSYCSHHRQTPPKADLNPPPWAKSGLLFNFLASYRGRDGSRISPGASNTRPSLLPDYRTCGGFAYLRNPQCFNIHNLFKWDYQTNSNSCFFPPFISEENPCFLYSSFHGIKAG